MSEDRPRIEPIRPAFHVQFLTEPQLDTMQEATLRLLEETGVHMPSEQALSILSAHGARVDASTQVVRFPRDLVMRAMAQVPRTFLAGARDPSCDLPLGDGATYFTTDGCGVEVVDLETGQQRPSCKEDVGSMARVADYLSSIAFYWPMVSAQDCGKTAPLHELDASWNNTVKHVQSETLMGAGPARYAIEMATVVAGSREELRRRPVLSLVLCTIAPLAHDREGIEGALLLAVYSAGLAIPFLLTALAFSKMTSAFAVIKRHYGVVIMVGGLVLIAMGILIWTGELYRINIEMQKWMSQVGLDFWNSI